MEKETVPINIEVPYAIHKEAKIAAAQKDIELWKYVVAAIDEKNKRG